MNRSSSDGSRARLVLADLRSYNFARFAQPLTRRSLSTVHSCPLAAFLPHHAKPADSCESEGSRVASCEVDGEIPKHLVPDPLREVGVPHGHIQSAA